MPTEAASAATPAPVQTPPATPAPGTGTPPATPAVPAVDPFVARIQSDFKKSVLKINDGTELPPETPEPEAHPTAGMVLGDRLALHAREEEEKKKAAEAAAKAGTTPPPATPATPAPATPAPAPGAATPPATPAAPTVRVVPSTAEEFAKLNKKIDERLPVQPAPAPVVPPVVVPPVVNPDDTYDAALPEEAQELMTLLKWAEVKMPVEFKGKATEQRGYLRKLEDFAKTNPEPEELEEWQKKNRPAIPPLRKVEREYLIEQATVRARAEVETKNKEEMDQLRQKQHELEMRPLAENTKAAFNATFEKVIPPEEIPEGATKRIPVEVMKAIREQGPVKALELFPIEAAAVLRHTNAAGAYIDISSGIAGLNLKNPDHEFLANFLMTQEQHMMRRPEGKRQLHGKTFLPATVYYDRLAKDPTTDQQFTTFNQQDVLQMLEEGAHISSAREVERLEKAGFKRAAPAATPAETVKPPEPAPVPTPTPTPTPSPRGGGGGNAPGAATPTEIPNPNATFLDKLMPGASKIVAGRAVGK